MRFWTVIKLRNREKLVHMQMLADKLATQHSTPVHYLSSAREELAIAQVTGIHNAVHMP